jgi:hypothetical protein
VPIASSAVPIASIEALVTATEVLVAYVEALTTSTKVLMTGSDLAGSSGCDMNG